MKKKKSKYPLIMLKSLKNQIVSGRHQRPILSDVFYKKNTLQKPVIIFCHGYKGFKDWGAWNLVAKHFASEGYFFIKFNFSHNGGTIEHPIDFPDLEAFSKNNYIKELDDLQSVIDWVISEKFPFKNQVSDNISLIGHSRGGGIAVIKAAETSNINNIITWAGVSDYASRFPSGIALEKWEENRIMYITNGRTKQRMPHEFQFYTNFKNNEEYLTISRATKALQIPHLIIHGTADHSVKLEEAKLLHEWNPNSTLKTIKDANHVFGAKHPWTSKTLPEELKQISIISMKFINN